jgi:hypothetical protein
MDVYLYLGFISLSINIFGIIGKFLKTISKNKFEES